MNYCGVCGAYLRAVDRTNGVCPLCGGALDAAEGPTAPASRPAPLWSGAMLGGTAPTAARRGWGRPALVALAALLVLVAASALIFALHGLPGTHGSPPTAHGASGGASATQTHAASPTTALGSNPTAAPDVTATVTPSATAAPIITVTASELPYLTVNPISINLGPCSARTTSFTVLNSGGGSFTWTASSSTLLITMSRTNGTLSGGQDVQVNVQDNAASGKITIDAPGVSRSPQTVSITCQGPL